MIPTTLTHQTNNLPIRFPGCGTLEDGIYLRLKDGTRWLLNLWVQPLAGE
ncbi:MAG: hypothetical protein ABSA54_01730 [Terriglobales bacterium]